MQLNISIGSEQSVYEFEATIGQLRHTGLSARISGFSLSFTPWLFFRGFCRERHDWPHGGWFGMAALGPFEVIADVPAWTTAKSLSTD